MEEISLYGVNGKPKWFMKLNPKGTVPVLTCNGDKVVLADSELILDYLQEGSADGDGSLCASDDIKGAVSEWRDIISRRLAPVGKQAVLGGKRIELSNLMSELDAKMVGPFLCGEQVTVADCAAFPFIWRIDQEYGLGNCEKLNKWLQNCMEIDAFKKTIQSSWWWWW